MNQHSGLAAREGREVRQCGDGLLGRRHRYKTGDAKPTLVRTARSIGFSPAEVAELERLYQRESMKDEL